MRGNGVWRWSAAGGTTREAALLLFDLVDVTVSTFCWISFACAQGEQLRDWNESVKPASIKVHRELQSVYPDGLSDEGLVAYLTRCRDHHARMMSQHMRFTAAALVPTGDFLAHVGDWTGLPPAEPSVSCAAPRLCPQGPRPSSRD